MFSVLLEVNLVAFESSIIQVDTIAKLLATLFSTAETSAAEAQANASAAASDGSAWRSVLWRWLSRDVQTDAHLQRFLSRLPELLGGTGLESLLFADRPNSLGELVASARSLIDLQMSLPQNALAAPSVAIPPPGAPLQQQYHTENIVAEPDSTSPNVDLLE